MEMAGEHYQVHNHHHILLYVVASTYVLSALHVMAKEQRDATHQLQKQYYYDPQKIVDVRVALSFFSMPFDVVLVNCRYRNLEQETVAFAYSLVIFLPTSIAPASILCCR
jgi:bacteriorhodopsin